MRSFEVNGARFNDSSEAYVIAEVGHNHQGSLETALKLIRAASHAGANAVKFQKRSNRKLFTSAAYDAPYASENSYGATYGLHREALEFGKDEYELCVEEARRCNIDFFSTAFDFESADFLANLDMPAYKIASGDLKSIPLIEYIAKIGKPVVLSTGGGELPDIDRAVEAVLKHNSNLALLQCTAGYPPEYSELNLKVIETFRQRYSDVTIGYSGHDSGIAMSLVAYVLGARVIEKHFTLNRTMKGTDHAFSLEPQGMQKLVRDITRAKLALGDGVKKMYPSEEAPLRKMGKSIFYTKSLSSNSLVREDDIDFRSPGDGIPPYLFREYLGKVLKVDVAKEEMLSNDHFE
jgi:N-acetylneuraminate synthase/sialic acid synthase